MTRRVYMKWKERGHHSYLVGRIVREALEQNIRRRRRDTTRAVAFPVPHYFQGINHHLLHTRTVLVRSLITCINPRLQGSFRQYVQLTYMVFNSHRSSHQVQGQDQYSQVRARYAWLDIYYLHQASWTSWYFEASSHLDMHTWPIRHVFMNVHEELNENGQSAYCSEKKDRDSRTGALQIMGNYSASPICKSKIHFLNINFKDFHTCLRWNCHILARQGEVLGATVGRS